MRREPGPAGWGAGADPARAWIKEWRRLIPPPGVWWRKSAFDLARARRANRLRLWRWLNRTGRPRFPGSGWPRAAARRRNGLGGTGERRRRRPPSRYCRPSTPTSGEPPRASKTGRWSPPAPHPSVHSALCRRDQPAPLLDPGPGGVGTRRSGLSVHHGKLWPLAAAAGRSRPGSPRPAWRRAPARGPGARRIGTPTAGERWFDEPAKPATDELVTKYRRALAPGGPWRYWGSSLKL